VADVPELVPTFVLGMGAGMPWLSRYLSESPAYAAGYAEEYHVFDSLYLSSESETRDRIFSLAEQALADVRARQPADPAALHRMSMYGNPMYYFDYFTGLLRKAPQRHVTADLTPAYALLPAERFEEIRQGFAERGVRTHPVFVMRDPITQATGGGYHRTIEALDATFGADVHYDFYERLFTHESLAALCAAVGIPMHPPGADPSRGDAGTTATPTPDEVRALAPSRAEVYRRVAVRFPEVDLAELWPGARYVL
jgi:hypothetical protein